MIIFETRAEAEQRNYPSLDFLFMAIISHSRNSSVILPAPTSQGGSKCKVASYQLKQGTANTGGGGVIVFAWLLRPLRELVLITPLIRAVVQLAAETADPLMVTPRWKNGAPLHVSSRNWNSTTSRGILHYSEEHRGSAATAEIALALWSARTEVKIKETRI